MSAASTTAATVSGQRAGRVRRVRQSAVKQKRYPSTAASAERLPASCKGWASSATPAKMPRSRWGAILTAAATNARYSARLHSRPNSSMPWKPSPIMRASVMPAICPR